MGKSEIELARGLAADLASRMMSAESPVTMLGAHLGQAPTNKELLTGDMLEVAAILAEASALLAHIRLLVYEAEE